MKPSREVRAFSLIEVVIATGIFAGAVAVILGLLGALLRNAAEAESALAAQRLPDAVQVELTHLARSRGFDRLAGMIPLMTMQGRAGEEAELTLGASGWQTFWHVTLPNSRFALLYGVLLCNARAMGEFGAVSVVSRHIRGETNTMPLHVEVLYNEYNFVAAFAVASLLALLALVTLALKSLIEWRHRDEIAAKF